MAQTTAAVELSTEELVNSVLASIEREREREREREIVSRRFGLFDRKETLEQIGEMLGITRERVRQLEKSVVIHLKSSVEQGTIPHIADFQAKALELLEANGQVSRISELTKQLTTDATREEQARNFYNSVGAKKAHDEKKVKSLVTQLIDTIKQLGEPKDIATIAKAASIEDPKQAAALASTSKHLATLNGRWGLVKWPMVNPKNIRDKIYVILKENGKHMHFNEISDAIKDSDFKRKDWGYDKGTVADIITEVLKQAGEPLHRDEIVKRVLKSRFVKETTILLNLQGKPQFKRVAKATYALSE